MKKLILVSCAGLLMTGCVMVPKTHISGMIANQPFDIQTPKDSTLAGLDVSVTTNGTVHLHIDTLQARMNPDVITMTGEAFAKSVNAAANAGAVVAGAAVQATK